MITEERTYRYKVFTDENGKYQAALCVKKGDKIVWETDEGEATVEILPDNVTWLTEPVISQNQTAEAGVVAQQKKFDFEVKQGDNNAGPILIVED